MRLLLPYLSVALLASSPAGAEEKRRAAVLPLQWEGEGGEAAASRVRVALHEAALKRRLAPLPLSETERLLAATDPSCSSAPCLVKAARLLGVQLMVGGRVSVQGKAWALSLWLFDARKGGTTATLGHRLEAGADPGAPALLARLLAGPATARVEVRSTPAGAAVEIDGKKVGVAGMAFGVSPGKHTVVVQLEDHKPSTYQVEARPGAKMVVEARLVAIQKPGPPRMPRNLKWVSMGLGSITLISGITLLVLDGRETCNKAYSFYQCPKLHENLAPGIALTAVGGLCLGAAAYLIYRDVRKARQRKVTLVPSVLGGGPGLQAAGRF